MNLLPRDRYGNTGNNWLEYERISAYVALSEPSCQIGKIIGEKEELALETVSIDVN